MSDTRPASTPGPAPAAAPAAVPPSPAAPSPDARGAAHDLADALGVVRKRKAWIAGAALAGLASAVLWTLSVPPEYEATAQIEITQPRGSVIADGSLAQALNDDDVLETHHYLLTSRKVLEATVTSLDLGKKIPAKDPRDWLRKRVSVDRVPNTRILRVHAVAGDADLARDIANTVVDVYEKQDIDDRVNDSKKRLAELTLQITDVKSQVEKSELDLIQYVEGADLDLVDIPTAEGDAKGTDLSPTGSNLLRRLEDERSEKQLALDQGLLEKTEAHPEIVKLRAELTNLDRRIGDEKKRVADENKKRIRYGMLRRDAEINRQLFAGLMRELKATNLVGDDHEPHILRREPAISPRKPSRPKPARDLSLGLAAGLLFGIGLAFLQESLDRTLKTREEIERAVGLPILGVIHRVGGARRPSGERFVLQPDGAFGPEVEDFRTLRTNLRFARPDGANKIILVTSTAPEEGKTTIATNLAVVNALAGERVLLIDADLRRPAVHLALGMENADGLTNLLVERGLDAGALVRPTRWPNLSVLCAGSFAPNPPEILESARMRELLATFAKKFDRVVIDSPPQTSVVDPSILAPLVDGVLLVVSAGRVEAERARLAHRQLAGVGSRFFGAVVNQLSRRGERYGYGYGYGGYGYGYHTPAAGTERRDAKDDAAA
ncbi:MAG TPA: polysaccharide biosynthesis tyrosine autokinase [bacterium]|nr:polysaccharide biosynthesis tyrosine autokinase [bacterium]